MLKIKHARTLSLLFALLLHFLNPILAQSLENRVDSLVRKNISDTSGPGAVVMITHHGKPVYQKAFGKANLELGVNLQPDYIFELGSMTKQFTSIAILILEEQGKLAVSDPVSKYVPDYPNGKNITIHHLLTHTSGIKDFTRMSALAGIAQKDMSPKMMVDFFKNEPVDFAPGEKFDYNNSGYVLLGYIIEVASGDNYENFIRKHIFDKAGMSESGYASDRKIIKKRAYGYQKKSSGYVNKSSISFSVPFSSGALMSTLADMLKWQNALNRHLLLSAKETDKAFTNYRLNNGQNIGYGYGWHITELNGLKSREHGGSIFGFKTMGVYIPKEDLYVLALSNCDCNSPTQLARDIASMALNSIRHQ